MRTEQITSMCVNRGRGKGEDCGHVKAVLLSWFIFVIVRL